MYCHECGTEIMPGHKFCPNCGTRLIEGTGAGNGAQAVPSKGVDQLEAAKRQVDVLSRAAGNAIHGKVSQVFLADKGTPGQTQSGTQPVGVADNRVMFLALDAAVMAVATFCPWVGSYFGQAKSLPGLVMNGMSTMSSLSQYSEYAYEYGGGSAYEAVMGFMLLIALVAAFGWGATMYYAWKDMSKDYRGERSDGNGAMTLAMTALIAKVLVWLGVFAIKSKLENDYFDLSYIGESAVYTTGWVWVSLAIGAAGVYLRKVQDKMPAK